MNARKPGISRTVCVSPVSNQPKAAFSIVKLCSSVCQHAKLSQLMNAIDMKNAAGDAENGCFSADMNVPCSFPRGRCAQFTCGVNVLSGARSMLAAHGGGRLERATTPKR